MKLEEAKKALIIIEKDPWLNTTIIDADIPVNENWESLGEDMYQSQNGFCGPLTDKLQRVFVEFDRIPTCPVCNGKLPLDDSIGVVIGQCRCTLKKIKGNYGIVT